MTTAQIIPSSSGKFHKVYGALIDEEGNVISEDNPLHIIGSETVGDSTVLAVDQKDLQGNSTGYELPEQTILLNDILKQLKIMNIHLSLLSDN